MVNPIRPPSAAVSKEVVWVGESLPVVCLEASKPRSTDKVVEEEPPCGAEQITAPGTVSLLKCQLNDPTGDHTIDCVFILSIHHDHPSSQETENLR